MRDFIDMRKSQLLRNGEESKVEASSKKKDPVSEVVTSLKATWLVQREQISKCHWLIKVSRAHFIVGIYFQNIFYFFEFLSYVQFFALEIIWAEKFESHNIFSRNYCKLY